MGSSMTELEKILTKRITDIEARLAFLEGRVNTLEIKGVEHPHKWVVPQPYQPQWIDNYKVTCGEAQ